MKIKFILIIFAVLALGSCITIKKKPEPFTVDPKSPQIQIGDIESQVDPLLAFGIKKITYNVSYYPVEDAVCLQFKQDFYTFQQFWSRDGRDAFAAALDAYSKDYEARNLNERGGRKAKRQYGVVEGYLIWQLWGYSVLARANMKVELGYTFDSRNPYFCVTQREAEYKDSLGRDNDRTSTVTGFLYTRAQAQELVKIFDQQFLDSLILGRSVYTEPDVDAY
jgi:hypothetical protein